MHYRIRRQDDHGNTFTVPREGAWYDSLEAAAAVKREDEEAAKIFGRQREKLRADGMLIGDSDIWIAVTALLYDPALLRWPDYCTL